MNQDKLIAEWMNRLQVDLSRCLIEELMKVDLTRLLRMTQIGAAAAAKPVEAPPEPTPETELHQPRHRQPGICTTEGCDRPARARGLCARHYQRAQYAAKREKALSDSPHAQARITPQSKAPKAVLRRRSSEATSTERMPAKCGHAGCERDVLKKGLCGKHFMEWVRTQRRMASQS